MSESCEHGGLKYTPAKTPRGITTAAIRGCCACGGMISGMGGGGIFIHKECWNLLVDGHMMQDFQLMKELTEESE